MAEDQRAVRPLGGVELPRNSPPPLVLVGVLLLIGGLVGWAIASLTGDSIATAAPTTLATSDSSPLGDPDLDPEDRPAVSWTEATSVPPFPGGMDYAGSTDPVEFDGSIFVVMRFTSAESRTVRNELWSSQDGLVWESSTIDLGPAVSVVELTAISDGLIVTGEGAGTFGLWRSLPGRALGGESWSRLPIETPANFEPRFYSTAMNQRSGVATAVIGDIEIWREVIAPYVPTDIDVSDPSLNFLDGVLHPSDGQSVEVFAEPPEVLTTDDTIWIRLVTLDGEEVLQTYDLPPDAYPVEEAPDLSFIPIVFAWISEDGNSFLPVTTTNALPPGYFLAEAWMDGFIAAGYELADAFAPGEDVQLWQSDSGRAWQLSADQPPRECSPFFFATSRDHLLLTAEDRTRCVYDGNDWIILQDPCTSCYAIGGPAGFLAYPSSFEYDTALFSIDGETWVDVRVPAPEPYPTLAILHYRLLAFSIHRPLPQAPTGMQIWIGDIG